MMNPLPSHDRSTPRVANKTHRHKQAVIFDVMYGFIPVTEWEEKIINSPFFQRLRWIKQLGFANYIFPELSIIASPM